MNMNSFYGGLQGQSFEIKEIFKSRYGTPTNGIVDSMEADLSKGWTSPITVGEFVIISYGLPSDQNYDIYRMRDVNVDGKTYNSTLWQKIYNEIDGTANGLNYKFISSMTGNTPRIVVQTPSEVLDANQEPDVIFDQTDVDSPKIKFKLPQSQILSMYYPINVLDADKSPSMTYDETNINRPTLHFSLPQSQRITRAVIEEYLDVGKQPEVRLDVDTDGTINEPVLKLKLPISQQLLKDNVLHDVLDANVKPYIDFDTSDANEPTLIFHLPQSQVMQQPLTETLDPIQNPKVTQGGTVNQPQLTFQLPRAVEFYYGSLLGERDEGTYTINDPIVADYGVGDYYINATTGFIYKVIAKNNNECTFQYMACIQSPLPEIGYTAISPYNADGSAATPTVDRELKDSEWKLIFNLPKVPILTASYDFVGSTESGTVLATTPDNDTVNFAFTIPAGSTIFAGTELNNDNLNAVIDNTKPGDIYLNTKTGKVYRLSNSRIWEETQDGLKGPVGDTLHVVRDYKIFETETLKDSLIAGVSYILDQYVDDQGAQLPITSDQLFAVTWIDFDSGAETAYWYYYTDDKQWGRVQLTSGVNNLFKSEHDKEQDGPVVNKSYSINYINKLIGGNKQEDETDEFTTFSKEQLYDMLSWGTF